MYGIQSEIRWTPSTHATPGASQSVQWTPSNLATLGASQSVLISTVDSLLSRALGTGQSVLIRGVASF